MDSGQIVAIAFFGFNRYPFYIIFFSVSMPNKEAGCFSLFSATLGCSNHPSFLGAAQILSVMLNNSAGCLLRQNIVVLCMFTNKIEEMTVVMVFIQLVRVRKLFPVAGSGIQQYSGTTSNKGKSTRGESTCYL